MSKYRSQTDRVNIVLGIVRQLKNYPHPNPSVGGTIDLYKDEYEYVDKFKNVFTNYIKQDDTKPSSMRESRGTIFLEGSLERDVEYILPALAKQEPLFVVRMKKRGN